jgi:phosphoenolpyruvate-protein kinase (PTS system EI component)
VEANPALGVRGVRLGLHYPELLEVQLQALLEAVPELPLHIMFPMVATLEEVRQAREALRRAASASQAAGCAVAMDVRVGIMVEVPAAALMADALAGEVDFFSIGTNDLIQYTLAADRTNAHLADLGTAFEPAVLRLVDQVCRAGRAHARPVAVCGEAAADPLIAPLLVGLGVSHLSVGVSSVRQVHDGLSRFSLSACEAAAHAALRAHGKAEVRAISLELQRTFTRSE